MPDPRVGIIIPAYNAARYLPLTLESVLAQTVADWHCTIVDDGSRDATVEVARSFAARDARFQVVVQPANGGVSRARTDGLAALRTPTPYIIFLDADDLWQPDALETLFAALEAAPDAPAAHASAAFIDAAGEPLPMSEFLTNRLRRMQLRDDGQIVDAAPTEPTTPQMLATWPCVITPGVVLIRRAAYDASGGWDASLSIGEDWELWYRLSLRAPLAFVPQALIRFRVYPTSSSSTWKRPMKLARARERVMNAAAATPAQRVYAKRAYRKMSRKLARERIGQGVAALAKLDVKGAARGLLTGSVNLALSFKPL